MVSFFFLWQKLLINILSYTPRRRNTEIGLLGSISVLTSCRAIFLPILSVKESKCFIILSLNSSLFLFFTVTTALTLNFSAFSAGTDTIGTALTKSSLTAATTGCFTTFLKGTNTLLFCKGLTKNTLLFLPWFKNTFVDETKEDLSIIEQPMISFPIAILFSSQQKHSSFFVTLSLSLSLSKIKNKKLSFYNLQFA